METSALSQYEVDSLAGALEEARAAQRAAPHGPMNVKTYDFRRPDKLSKDQIRTLQMMHETFARLLTSSLSSYLRMPVQAHLTEIEQSSSDEYIHRIQEPTILTLVSLRPLPGRAVLGLSVPVAFTILDRLLGGEGRASNWSGEVTDIELSLLESVASTFLSVLQEVWTTVAVVETHIEQISLDPQFLQRALPKDSIVTFTLELVIKEVTGTLHIGIPYTTIEPVVDKLHVQHWFARSATSGEDTAQRVRERLEEASVPVRAELGHAVVTVRELTDLQPGDVIHLNTFIDQEMDVYVGQEPKFRARPGLLGTRLAIQITRDRRAVRPPHEAADAGPQPS